MRWPMTLPTDSVDAYAFFGSWPHWPVPEDDENTLLTRLDRLSMRAAVLMSLRTVFGDMDDGNDELAGLTRHHPDRLVGLATFDPRQSNRPADVMERARQAGMRGLALFPANHGYALNREALVDEALWLAAEWRWPVVIPTRLIMSWWMPVTPIDSIMEIARRHPKVAVVATSGNYSEFDKMLGALGELSNLYIELSGTQSLDAMTQLVERGDSSRLLFGTGQPLQMPECNLVKLAYPPFDERVKRAILRDNAAGLFGL
jgi:predicted TIM-barrel fold metal-dependent hydrolase